MFSSWLVEQYIWQAVQLVLLKSQKIVARCCPLVHALGSYSTSYTLYELWTMYTFETVIVNFVLFSKFIQSLLILFSKKIVCKAYQCEDSSHLILIKRMYPNRRYWWGKGNKSYLLWNHYIHIKPLTHNVKFHAQAMWYLSYLISKV